MEREFIAHHIKEDDSGLEHPIASKQPKKYSEDYSKHSMDSKDGHDPLQKHPKRSLPRQKSRNA